MKMSRCPICELKECSTFCGMSLHDIKEKFEDVQETTNFLIQHEADRLVDVAKRSLGEKIDKEIAFQLMSLVHSGIIKIYQTNLSVKKDGDLNYEMCGAVGVRLEGQERIEELEKQIKELVIKNNEMEFTIKEYQHAILDGLSCRNANAITPNDARIILKHYTEMAKSLKTK
jgi:hypothetical protein